MTAAELSFLLASGDRPGQVPRLLGLTDADRTDAVLSAGVGSLLLRHLAAPVDGATSRLDLSPAVAAVAQGLHRPRGFVQLGLTAEDHADGALLLDAERIRMLVAARAYRCYDITPLPQGADVRDALLAVADKFLHRHRPAVATFAASSAADFERGVQPPRATLSSSADGKWLVVTGDGTQTKADDFDAAAAVLRDELAKMIPVEVPSS
ncbi:hypothetical protein Dvina_33955 [Dactylosporangium vinaceum]|uniref:Uncharacterized protein n=1 Tax=Dactylosporangium vinaceum TaxID=53362 RepID=A0ABV5MMF4_9ACTN|nr:hypothetical protein [Dactylosporangium vinaceum]UAB93258.1 hypothetical protein Dvina_33955 [Dactylosporangium vinaceum]